MKTQYVLGFMFDADLVQVALIQKNKPTWQAGKLNGIGGKIEETDVSQSHAMAREFWEEAGMPNTPEQWSNFATMAGPDWCVYCFATRGELRQIKDCTDEKTEIVPVSGIVNRDAVENVEWLVGMAVDHLRDGRPVFSQISYP